MASPRDTDEPHDETPLVEPDEFAQAFGESLREALDLDTWRPGEDLLALYDRLEREVRDAVRQQDQVRRGIRAKVLPEIERRPSAPEAAGVYQATVEQLGKIHRGLLFRGAVEACDGTSLRHDSLPLTLAQIGVSLISYRGDQGTWAQQLFRRDLRQGDADPMKQVVDLLSRRQARAGLDQGERRDRLSQLARRGILAYAERAILVQKATAPWRVGHGHPMPYELLTGSGSMELLDLALPVARALVEWRQFLFVPSAPSDRAFLTIGDALQPLEYAVLDTARAQMQRVVDGGHYSQSQRRAVQQFVDAFGPQIVIGVYRASAAAPPALFYAHAERAHEAALIALADSTLQEHRGFPLLIDLADLVCRSAFGAETFQGALRLAYAEAGDPWRYLAERETRKG